MPLLQLNEITVAFGGPPVLDHVGLVLEAGERLCVLGRNGAGKSTLLKVILGEHVPDTGEVVRPSGLRIAYLGQQVPGGLTGSVLDIATSGAGSRPHRPVTEHVARATISRVGLDPEAAVAALSAGLKRRALLACALASEPELLLLDEPTNHLDIEAIAWLEEFLQRQRKTLLFVTHDRAFLRRVATGILDLDRGRLARHDADYDRYLVRKQGNLEAEARSDRVADKELAKEETWVRQGIKARRKRDMGRVSRLYELREQRSARRDLAGTVKAEAQSAARSGRLVMEAKDISFDWDGAPAVRKLSTTILRGDRVGIIGANGTGKTTLLRLLLGELEPREGSIRHGVNLEIGYFDQLHAHLDLDASAVENVSKGSSTVTVNGKPRQTIRYLTDFLFTADQARNPVRMFSGGERNRLLLARLFVRPSNLLVLDEPTNDLDVETLEVLEGLLAEYEGTILIVSHDRELIDHVVTSTLVLEGEGRVRESVGGYTDWLEKQKQAAKAEVKPEKGGKRRGRPGKVRPRSPLSRDEKRELKDLPAQIDALEEKLAGLHETMSDPAFFRQDGAVIAEAQAALKALEDEIKAAYARWEALEEKASS
jgi:ABC transport system ATP-binding/permease protein